MSTELSSVYARKHASILKSLAANLSLPTENYQRMNYYQSKCSSTSDVTDITADDLSVSTKDTIYSITSKDGCKTDSLLPGILILHRQRNIVVGEFI